MEIQSHGNISLARKLLEQLVDMVVRLDQETRHGVIYSHRVGEIGGYRNDYKPVGLVHSSGSLNSLTSS